MARIVRLQKVGGPEGLVLGEETVREPGEGEVKLRVSAVGLNRAELLYLQGNYFQKPQVPARVGYEAAGTVIEVGPGVDPSWKGKRVATVPGFEMNQYGVLGEEAVVPAWVLGEYPENLTPVQGASIWMQYATSYGALKYFGKLTKGDAVIISAASSSVGLAAIEMVRAEGGIAIATTRTSAKREALLKLGAHHVIATDEEDLVQRVREITHGEGARLVFDAIGGEMTGKYIEATAKFGTVFLYGWLSLEPTTVPVWTMLNSRVSLTGYVLFDISEYPDRIGEAKRYINERLQDGRFKPEIAKTFPLEQYKEAFEYLASNQQIGKVVIDLGRD